MRFKNQDLLLSTTVAMVLAAGCAPKAPVVPDVPAVSPGPGTARASANGDEKEPAARPLPGEPNPPPDQPPGPPPEESALADSKTSDLVDKLGNGPEGQAAARVLAKRGGPEVIQALASALSEDRWQVRAGAAFALGQMGKAAETAKAALERAAADDPEQAVRDAATFALDAIAEETKR